MNLSFNILPKNVILAVDDEELNLLLLEKILSKDYVFYKALDAKEAENILENSTIDLILLDIMMPEVDGFDFCKKLKSSDKYKHIPIIFLSAKDSKDDIIKGLQLGAIDYLTKPFIKEELLARIHTNIQNINYHKMHCQIQQQMFLASKFISVGTLAAGIAHEINNPLAVIMGFTELIQKTESLSPKGKEYIEKILEHIQRIKTIIEHLREFVNENKDKYFYNFNWALNKALLWLTRKLQNAGINLIINIDDNLCELYGHISDMEVVIQHLIKNSYEAFEAITDDRTKTIQISAHSDNEGIYITYEDNACGIDPTILDRVYDPFFTTKNVGQGMGLGLYIVRSIIENYKGQIFCESEPGQGTIFKIFLPRTNKTT